MTYLARQIKDAQLPVLLLGMRASSAAVTKAIRELLSVSELPVVETFQGAGSFLRIWKTTSLVVSVCSATNQGINCCNAQIL